MKIPNLDAIKNDQRYFLIGEALEALKSGLETIGQKNSMNPQGNTNAPAPPSAIAVSAADGVHHVTVSDSNPRTKQAHYFLEYDHNQNFSNPQTIHLGVSRQHRIFIGNQPVFWRAYSQYPDGPRSEIVYHGSATAPTAVNGGGALAGPSFPQTTGSGTAAGGGYGFGKESFVSNPVNPGRPPKVFAE